MEGTSSSILVSMMSDMLRVSRSDFSEFRRASGVEGPTGAEATEGVEEGVEEPASAA